MTELRAGAIWRTRTDRRWVKINAVMLPGSDDYDGGAPGVAYTVHTAPRATGKGKGWFMLAPDYESAERKLRASGVFPEREYMDVLHEDAIAYDEWRDKQTAEMVASDPDRLRAMAERWADRAEADEPVWIETTEGWRFHVNSISGVLHAVATAMEEAGEP